MIYGNMTHDKMKFSESEGYSAKNSTSSSTDPFIINPHKPPCRCMFPVTFPARLLLYDHRQNSMTRETFPREQ